MRVYPIRRGKASVPPAVRIDCGFCHAGANALSFEARMAIMVDRSQGSGIGALWAAAILLAVARDRVKRFVAPKPLRVRQ